VNDENTKNQDSKLDENPEKTEDGAAQNATDKATELDAKLLLEVDGILNAEDPDFLNQLTQINIDTEVVDLSITDKSLGLDHKFYTNILNALKRPFEFSSNTRPVITFWLVLVSAVMAGIIAWNFKSSLLDQSLFLNSFAELGTDIKEFNPNNEVESFYDNIRFAKNLTTISAMHVNLKMSENSGLNPMLAIEIIAEGLSVDAIIEVKDREAELKDLLLRLTEQKTYDELAEIEGKQFLCEQYRDLLNSNLTRGQVRRVLLKSFIIKP